MASSFYSMVSQLFESITPTNFQSSEKKTSDSSYPDNIDLNNRNNRNGYHTNKCEILSTNFNQDNTCISVATRNGFRIFQCKPFTKAFECIDSNISCRCVSMLFATSLVALIGNESTMSNITSLRNVKLYNTKNKQELCRLNFKSTVISVKMNKTRLAVCVENKIHIFDLINNMKQIHEIITYPNNVNGIFDICCDEDNNLLCYPDNSKQGSIGILDAYNLQKRTIIDAHINNQLQILQFNADGNYLCSMSTMGTLLRIFAISKSGSKATHIYTFRRGVYPSIIYSISFNLSSTLLAITSHTNTSNRYPTIHIFDLNKYKYNKSKQFVVNNKINKILPVNVNEYLPQTVKNQIEHPRSIITINIKHYNTIIKCGWFNDYTLLAATKNGFFYRYNINDQKKEYKLLSEHTLRDNQTDLHKQQKTKIYKNKKKKKSQQDEIKEENKEVKKDEIKEINNNGNNNNNNNNNKKTKLGIDDLFDLSDAEFVEETETGDLP